MLSVICIIEKALTSNIGSLVYCLPNLSTLTLHTLNLLRSSKKLIRVHNPIILLSMKYVNQLHYPPRHSIKSYTNLLNENGNNYSWKKKPVVEAIDKALIISSFALSYNWSIWCNNKKNENGLREWDMLTFDNHIKHLFFKCKNHIKGTISSILLPPLRSQLDWWISL